MNDQTKTDYPSQYEPSPYYYPGGPPPAPQAATVAYPPQVGIAQPPHAPMPPLQRPQTSWMSKNRKNKPQSNSVGAGGLIFISGGMNIAWSFQPSTLSIESAHIRYCWFLAAIIGAILGALLTNRIPKKFQLTFSAVLVTIGGILFVACSREYSAIVAARYLDGIATGLVFVPTFVLIGEEVVPSMRGMNAGSMDMMCFSTGICIQMIYNWAWPSSTTMSGSFNSDEMHGIFMIMYGVIGVFIVYSLMIESPVQLLVDNKEEEAIDALRRLQRPFIVTQETYEQLIEHKSYIAVNKAMSLEESCVAGLPALLKMCYYRIVGALSFSMIFYTATLISAIVSTGSTWPLVLLGTLRFVGSFIAFFLMDSVGRKKPMLVSTLICGGMAIGICCFFNTLRTTSASVMMGALCMIMVYQFFSAFMMCPSGVYLTEAFPLAVKNYYIAIAFICEMLVHIIILNVTYKLQSFSIYFGVLAGFALILFVSGIVCLPETKLTTLREAQALFRTFVVPRPNQIPAQPPKYNAPSQPHPHSQPGNPEWRC